MQSKAESKFDEQRGEIGNATLEKSLIERIVKAHLDLYLPAHPDVITIDHDMPSVAQTISSIYSDAAHIPPDAASSHNGHAVAIDTHNDPNTTII